MHVHIPSPSQAQSGPHLALRRAATLLALAVALGLLYALSLVSYLTFHAVVELSSIGVAVALLLISWPAQRYRGEPYILFLASGYLAAAALDLLHTLAYKGMGVFPDYDANLPTQLWVAARYLQALTMLAVPFLLKRRLPGPAVVGGFGVVVAALLAAIFGRAFPAAWVEGQGLTPFKIGSEYVISAILLAAMVLLYTRRALFEPTMLFLLMGSLCCAVAGELFFTLYVDVYGLPNFLGHVCKVASFYMIYRAVVVTGLERPYDVVFRTLRDSQAALARERETLARERDNLVGILDAMSDCVIIVDRDWHILYTNPAMRAEYGPPNGQACHEYLHCRGERCADCSFEAAADGGTSRWQFLSPVNARTYDVLDTHIHYPGNNVARLKIMRDITELQEAADRLRVANDTLEQRVNERTAQLAAANEALRASEERFRVALSGGRITVAHADTDLRYTWLYHPAPAAPSGDWLGRRDDELLPARDAEEMMALKREVVESGRGGRRELTLHHGGRTTVYDVAAEPLRSPDGQVVGVTTAALDITEQRQAQRALVRAEKLSLAAKMAASIAHEIKNPLQSVIGCLGLAREMVAAGKDATRYFDVASEELHRANRLLTQMRDMREPIRDEQRVPSDVNALVARVLTLSDKEAQNRGVTVAATLGEGIPRLCLVPGQLEQVVLNLVLNALDAMSSGGRLTVSTWADNGGAAIRVADTGLGMTREVAERIFDDSFSTKPHGLGLGLAVSRGIIEGYGGEIEVQTAVDEGTALTVHLPAALADAQGTAKPVAPSAKPAAPSAKPAASGAQSAR
ncbi:MAG: PAS domain-containing protein [Chloroflexi bacterium]|nr:PAS domain-containing protein [Chloroflexota bacterium]